MGRLTHALAEAAGVIVLWIPGGIGSRLRRTYYRMRGATLGSRSRIDVGVTIDNPSLVSIGSDTWIDRNAVLIAGHPRAGRETRTVGPGDPGRQGRISIGDQCHIGAFTILSGMGGLTVGNRVTIAAGSKVYSLTHHYRSWADPGRTNVVFGSMAPDDQQSMLEGPVVLEDNVGIGTDCLLLPGTRIARDSFVRPGSRVRGAEFPENSLIAGDPATREGTRFQP